MEDLQSLKFRVAFGAVRHFGKNLYSTNPPAIAELVANAWDAYAKECKIYIESDKILIVDTGIGMTDDEFQDRYATSGNEKDTNIRKPEGMKERPYMGKKGIGKFSAFSLADEYILYTKSEDDIQWKKIELKQEILSTQVAEYEVPINRIESLKELEDIFGCDLSGMETGTIIYLPQTRRASTQKTINSLEKLLSHRFSITTIINDGAFSVVIVWGGKEQKLDLENHFYYNDIEYLHYFGYSLFEIQQRFPTLDNQHLIAEANFKEPIKGWVGSVSLPSSLIVEDTVALKGVCVYINGKLVDEDILRSIKKDRLSDPYFVGEVDADYLGQLSEDVVLSSREGLFLDNEKVIEVKEYIEKIRKNLVSCWDEMRKQRPIEKQEYLQKLLSNQTNRSFYNRLDEKTKDRFNKYAQRLFDRPKANVDDSLERLSTLLFSALLQIVNNEGIQDLIEQDKGNEVAILECFSRIFNLAEINQALRMRDGVKNKLNIISELEKFIQSGEVEKVFEKHLAKNPWLIEPTWISKVKNIHTQDYYTVLNINNGDTQRYYTDIIVEVSDEEYPIIIEIKREKATPYSMPNVNEIITQIYNYQKGLSGKLTKELNKDVAARDIKAYFICGQKEFDSMDRNDREKLSSNGIAIKSYDELIRTSKRIYEVGYGDDIAANMDSEEE